MKQTLKKELKKAFEAPEPLHKSEFIQSITPVTLNTFDFFLIQFRYIRKRIWGLSAFIFLISLSGSLVISADMLWIISAFMPLLALLCVAETGRSEYYEMAELETATRFSLKSVTLARLGLLGLGNLLLFGLLFPVSLLHSQMLPLQAGLYIVTPFLLTAFICLYIVRRWRDKETLYLCTGISVCISIFVYPLHLTFPRLCGESTLAGWIAASALLCIGIFKEYYTLLHQEELTWNFS